MGRGETPRGADGNPAAGHTVCICPRIAGQRRADADRAVRGGHGRTNADLGDERGRERGPHVGSGSGTSKGGDGDGGGHPA